MEYETNPPITAVAVSGGADSLYTLVSLHEAEIPVLAVHGLFASGVTSASESSAPSEGDAVRERLAATCSSLGISLHIIDLSQPFMDKVIRPFTESYLAGETPNPCALCNAHIKFGLLLDAARELGAERLATGHYVRMALPEDPVLDGSTKEAEYTPALLQGTDPQKDQSYFLSLTPLERLRHAWFPLGTTHKSDVLATLARNNITVPQPKESQGVCFIPGNEYRDFIADIAQKLDIPLPGPGPMLLEDGTRLGTHKGLWQYTEGQRHGLGIGWKEPLRVLAKEHDGNILRLGPRESLWTESCQCDTVNILLPPEFWPETVLVKTRYREPPRSAVAYIDASSGENILHIRFLTKETAVAPGQVAAIYIPLPGRFEPDGRPVLRLVAGGLIAR